MLCHGAIVTFVIDLDKDLAGTFQENNVALVIGEVAVPITFSCHLAETFCLKETVKGKLSLLDAELAVANKVANILFEMVHELAVIALDVTTWKVSEVSVDIDRLAL